MGALHATRHLRILSELQQYGRRRRTSRAEQDGVVYARRSSGGRQSLDGRRGQSEGPQKAPGKAGAEIGSGTSSAAQAG